ncbi:MAG: three-helix bundle dimerization domain-containing protein [Syntrophales bacterium]
MESNDKTEQIKHRQSVEYLSGILGMPRERIIAVYEQELNQMGRMVQVRDYLPILVSRRVKNLLQRG